MRLQTTKGTSPNGRGRDDEFILGSCSDHGRIMLKSSAIVNDASVVCGKFLLDFGVQFCVAGAVFGEVGG